MKTIMIVDEDVDVLEKVKSFLEENNFEVITTKNSREALKIMDYHEEDFGLILIDTKMPDEDKSAFFSMKPNSKINLGNLDDFLQKPFTKEQLIDFVKKNMEKK